MTLSTGTSLSFYEILGPLGAGGMGEVWRAKDTRLEREVAIKVLPEELAGDEERLRRFEREAKTLASLNHPNVAGIYGVDQEGDVCFLALELVPGEDLAARLSRGPLPVAEAIDVCRQIAEGLEAAHEAGVVHRDLKPANVRITPDGRVKVLDFGLAKPMHPETSDGGTTTAKSDSFLMTEDGLVLGTPTYMSPEQARGKPVDRRTDIWAFGCVLYECLTGKRAYGGDSLTDILASIVTDDPDWSLVPPVPARVNELLRRTLTKDPRERLRDVGEARVALERAAHEPVGADAATTETAATASHGPERAWSLGATALIALALAAGFLLGRGTSGADPADEDSTALREAHVQVHEFPPGHDADGFQIAPDGRAVAWSDDEGLWIRWLEEPEPLHLYAGEVEGGLCWSPDGRELGFGREGATWRIAASGGIPTRIAGGEADSGRSSYLAWLDDGRILIGGSDQVWTVPAEGGPREVLLELEREMTFGRHWHLLHLLPDGGVLGALHDYSVEFNAIHVYRDGESEVVLQIPEGEFEEIVVTGDRLVYSVKVDGEESVWSAPFSLEEAKLLGSPTRVLQGASNPSVSRYGTLAYLASEGDSGNRQLAWLDLDGGEPVPFDEPREYLRGARISPDGKEIAFAEGSISRTVFQVHDLERGLSTPVIKFDGPAFQPIWLDGGRLAISSFLDPRGSFAYSLSGRGEPERLSEDLLFGVSPDGQTYVYATIEPTFDEARFRMVGPGVDGEDLPYLDSKDRFTSFSPDGKWMLFNSERSGTWQIYLSPLPPEGDRDWPVCVGEIQSTWFREDLSAIYYVERDSGANVSTIHRVDLKLEPEVRLGAPEAVRQLVDVTVTDYAGEDRFLVVTGTASGRRRAFVHLGWGRDVGGR